MVLFYEPVNGLVFKIRSIIHPAINKYQQRVGDEELFLESKTPGLDNLRLHTFMYPLYKHRLVVSLSRFSLTLLLSLCLLADN